MYYRLLVLVLVLVLSNGTLWAESFAKGQLTLTPSYNYSHVSHPPSFRDAVWNLNANHQGEVHDPSGTIIKQSDEWDLGHKYGYERWRMEEYGRMRGWSDEEFVRSQNNLKIYRPELRSSNRSHMYEMPKSKPTSRYLARKYDKLAGFSRSNTRPIGRLKSLTPRVLQQSVKTLPAAHNATRLAGVLRIVGGAAGIVIGAVDIGNGIYEWREIDRRFYAGELDYDIATGKRVVVVGRMMLGGAAIAAGVLIIVPEPIITKAIAAGLTIGIIVGHAVLMVVDYILDRSQAKRLEHRRKLLSQISWDARRRVCVESLRTMASKI